MFVLGAKGLTNVSRSLARVWRRSIKLKTYLATKDVIQHGGSSLLSLIRRGRCCRIRRHGDNVAVVGIGFFGDGGDSGR